MKLYVVRHGETAYNVKNLICGVSDVELTALGRQQAIEIHDEINNIKFDKILVSPLKRAIETCELITDQDYIIEQRLIEVNFGIFEGQSRTNQEFQSIKYNLGKRYPEGETFLEVIHRIYSLLDELKESNLDTILLVCHGAVMRAIHSYFNELTNDEMYKLTSKNCEIKVYYFKK